MVRLYREIKQGDCQGQPGQGAGFLFSTRKTSPGTQLSRLKEERASLTDTKIERVGTSREKYSKEDLRSHKDRMESLEKRKPGAGRRPEGTEWAWRGELQPLEGF